MSHGPRGCAEPVGRLGLDEPMHAPAGWHLHEEAAPNRTHTRCTLMASACGRAKRAGGEEPILENGLDDEWPTPVIDRRWHAGAQKMAALVSKHSFPPVGGAAMMAGSDTTPDCSWAPLPVIDHNHRTAHYRPPVSFSIAPPPPSPPLVVVDNPLPSPTGG